MNTSSIVQTPSRVHLVRVRTPDDRIHDVQENGFCGLRRALKVAQTITGWFGVSDWESASVFTPRGVRRIIRDLQRLDPEIDLTACVIEVVTPAEAGPDAPGGWEVVVAYNPLGLVPELVKDIRQQAHENDWRLDGAQAPTGPHFAGHVMKEG